MSQENGKEALTPTAKAIGNLKLRAIGPAVMGGRIAHITVHPRKKSTWYVAVGSGNLWKTTNAGITWKPIFEDQGSYSLGTVALDPRSPETVWLGTGENVSGRHVGWGDGVYKSLNGGQTWQNMGLKRSDHIGKILIDPRDGDVVLVAAEGPLWSAGGERGVYRTADGGATWELVLEIDENTGVTDIEFDPENPDVVYAAAYQRRRHTWSFVGGGPNSGIYKSTDNGQSWRKVTVGLPKGDMGKIGLSVTPADPSLVFATIEANEEEKGFYRSTDKGESWEKRSSYISGGTGPHYYQVIEASPHDRDTIYQMDVFVHVTRDGGENFKNMETGKSKHSDNHALWIDPDDAEHLLLGCDAGLYESFDGGGSWRHFPNLPISQFYRLAVDNSAPFFNILGGAQDLGTLFGPSRTNNVEGVRNQDWFVPLGADGYHVDFDPEDPQTMYMEWQNGNIMRYDGRSDEALDIKPLPAPGEEPERWNWDTPFFVSSHNNHRLYTASHRLWRSDDRGDSWTAISPDLTRGGNRYELPHMGRVWSVDDILDNFAMSQYATVSKIAESPLAAGVLYAGTDDGLIQVSEDGGQSWRRAADLPGVPDRSFIIGVEASQHDADTVFAIADAHKLGDYDPYIFVSNDRGRSWRSIAGDLPAGTILWALQQDHERPELLFLGAEYGLYTSLNGGENWHKLSGGVPTIAFRDIKIQRRDCDLAGATFGRGFYVLDDYTPLRDMVAGALENEAHLFPIRDAWWYVELVPMQAPGQPTLGDTSFVAENPPFGAVITYHLKEGYLTAREARHKREKSLREENKDIPFPGYDNLRAEALESKPQLLILIRDAAGEPVRWLEASAEAGLHRVAWDLRLSPPDPIDLHKPAAPSPWSRPPIGSLAAPGDYQAQLVLVSQDSVQGLSEPQRFTVKPVPTTEAVDFTSVTAFQNESSELAKRVAGLNKELERSQDRLNHLRAAMLQTPERDEALYGRIDRALSTLDELSTQVNGDARRQKLAEPADLTINHRLWRLASGHWYTRQPPTATQRQSLAQAQTDFETVRTGLAALIQDEIVPLEKALDDQGAPWTPGRAIR